MTNETFKFLQEIKRAIQDAQGEFNPWFYGKIQSYNKQSKRAIIKPLINVGDDRSFIDIPPIPNVPVMHYACGEFIFKIPFAEGDIVRLIFTNVGLDAFQGKQMDEAFKSRHSMTNCFAMPCEYSNESNLFEVNAGGLLIKMQKRITLEANSVKILTNISNQLGQVVTGLSQIATALAALGGDATVPPMSPSPQPLAIKAAMLAAGTAVNVSVTEITKLKVELDKVI